MTAAGRAGKTPAKLTYRVSASKDGKVHLSIDAVDGKPVADAAARKPIQVHADPVKVRRPVTQETLAAARTELRSNIFAEWHDRKAERAAEEGGVRTKSPQGDSRLKRK